MTIQKTRWTPTDVHHACALYYLGATSDELSQILKKTSQSIQKKLDRICAKPKPEKSYIYKITRHIPTKVGCNELKQHLLKVCHDLDIKEQSDLGEVLEKLNKAFPIQKTSKKKAVLRGQSDLNTKKEEAYADPRDKSLKDICAFLNQHHIYPRKLSSYSGRKLGFTHEISGHWQRPTCLLVKVNKIQQAQKKDIFFLEGYTET